MTTNPVPLSRRRLLGACAGVVAAAALPARVASAQSGSTAATAGGDCEPVRYPGALIAPERIGIQLYTMRDQVNSIGFAKVFDRLSKIGYSEVEFAGYGQGSAGPITLAELRMLLDDHGLRGSGAHANPNVNNIDQRIEDALVLGLPAIGVATTSGGTGTEAGWQQTADNFNVMGEKCRDAGMFFYVHNHTAEFNFVNDRPFERRIYDLLLEETDSELVFFEMDIYWAYAGQHRYGRPPYPTFDPVDYVTTAPDRFPMFHVKDGTRNQLALDGYSMADVGQGDIDFGHFFRSLGRPELHSYYQEHDTPTNRPGGSWRSAIASYGWMRHGLVDFD